MCVHQYFLCFRVLFPSFTCWEIMTVLVTLNPDGISYNGLLKTVNNKHICFVALINVLGKVFK